MPILTLNAIIILGIFLLTCILFALIHRRSKHHHISKENEFQAKLQEEESKFETVFTRAQHSIAIINLDGHVIKANRAFCDLLGYDEADMLALNYFYIINHADMNNLQINIQHLLDNSMEYYQSEHECFNHMGDVIWIQSILSLIRDANGAGKYFIVQIENITSQKNVENHLRHMAYHDPLTGVANRNKLEHFISQLLENARRQQQAFALLMLDLDGFKGVNDTLGHDGGDILLKVIAERLKNSVRTTDMVARLGGDEFVILVTDIDIKRTDAIANIAQKILNNIMQAIIIKGHDVYITTSIGISIYPEDGETLETLMNCADMGLYRAKEQGKNNYQFYTQEMTAQAKEKIEIKNALSKALSNNEFYLHYLPMMDIKTRRITGVEALLRWNNENYLDIKPDKIIALSEESGLIVSFSDWILKTACTQLKEWHDMGFTSLTMSVNCTSRQFKQATFIENIKSIVTDMEISPELLEVEITEKMIMKDTDNVLHILDALKEIGLKIVIDDFGTGYWSIGNLRKLSVDKIKIDRTYTKKLGEDKTSSEITNAIIAMVNKLGMISVAEGVETREQFDYLVQEGCCEIQGFYLSKPLPAEDMTQFLYQSVSEKSTLTV